MVANSPYILYLFTGFLHAFAEPGIIVYLPMIDNKGWLEIEPSFIFLDNYSAISK
jgi:hypothetical protein